jgi:hypothetical protein
VAKNNWKMTKCEFEMTRHFRKSLQARKVAAWEKQQEEIADLQVLA